MLGTEKSVLKGLGFSNFIDVELQDAFYHHRRQVIETRTQQTCELNLTLIFALFLTVITYKNFTDIVLLEF